MPADLILHIAVPTPLRRLFDYLPPEDLAKEQYQHLKTGIRVLVPLGNRKVVAMLVSTSEKSELAKNKLKAALAILDDAPILPAAIIKLLRWSADYYHHPLGESWLSVLPTLLRKGEALSGRQHSYLRLSTWGKGLADDSLSRAKKQQQLIRVLRQHQALALREILEDGHSRAAIKALKDKKLIEEFQLEAPPQVDIPAQAAEKPLRLNEEQQQATEQIIASIKHFSVLLLEGVTGSGKTEVYLQAIAAVLEQGKQALVLVPEIGLTPQTVKRFKNRFHCPIVALHSGLNDRERLDSWLQSSRDQTGIIIGTRSAIFVPMAKPGIIIIDEEHDISFKQQKGFRYSARDLAVMRGQYENIPVVLGSATPSIETLHNAQYRRYQHLKLTQRAGNAQPPDFRLIDIRHQELAEGLSPELIEAIKETIEAQQQVLIFLNRRGFAPTLICHDCGWIAECHHCELRMTVHRSPAHLHCHHCDHQQALPQRCPQCKSQPLAELGQGTERCELILQQLFPDTPLFRIDRDTTQRKSAMQNMVDAINRGGSALLVGTQMLAKGHHFPDVTLVAILDSDAGLFGADFRAPERMGQLLIQVAGRAGRAEKPGKVYIQTHFPEHPLITTLIARGYHPFAQDLLAERKQLGLPPCGFMALVRSEHQQPQASEIFLREVRAAAENLNLPIRMLGPLPSPLAKKAGRFRFQLLFVSTQRQQLQQLLKQLIPQLESLRSGRKVRWSVDIDPQDMY